LPLAIPDLTMRLSKLPIATLRETPAEAEIVSHRLMLRSGMVRRLASGLFTWMPMGWRVARIVERVTREEMERIGAHELLMPAVHPAELWRESGRWQDYGDLLLKMRDRGEREYCFGPTHEEVVTDIARRELKSYRQLPVSFFQVQTKFRDEIRPRFGVMRSREFLMKDAYSFHLGEESLREVYGHYREAYKRVFERLGLKYRVVQADSGEIGGSRSQEFHVLADSGEDLIAWCDGDDFAANLELAPALPPEGERAAPGAAMSEAHTPGMRTIRQVAAHLDRPAEDCLKTLLVKAEGGGVAALVLCGQHEVNELKATALPEVAKPLQLANAQEVAQAASCPPGFLGPVGLRVKTYVDHAAAHRANFVCGANRRDKHLVDVNWGRDLPEPETADLRNAVEGDLSPGGGGTLEIARGIEVGHIFQLGDKYSRCMNAAVLDENGAERHMQMGCYGLGVTRTVAAAIEQNHDERGIIWPEAMAPFSVVLVALNAARDENVRATAEQLHDSLRSQGVEVLFDDRDASPGVKLADADLIGIPHRVVVSARGLKQGTLEYKHRRSEEAENLSAGEAAEFLQGRLAP